MSAVAWIDAGPLQTLPPGSRRMVRAGRTEIALLNVDGALYAVDNRCPHRGGALCEGDLAGLVLYCPLHAWPFDLRTGQCTQFEAARVRTFDVRVTEGRIEIALGERKADE